MAKDNEELAGKIDSKKPLTPARALQDNLDTWRRANLPRLAAIAGDPAVAEKVFVICMNTISRNAELLSCTFDSITACILQSFQLNLYPGPFQECAYVPLNRSVRRGNDWQQVKEANFWPQYQGLTKLMLNAGNRLVIGRVVREGDFFDYREGAEAPIYKPAACFGKKRGEVILTYGAVQNEHGVWRVEVLDEDSIAATKARSRGAQKKDSPWNSQYNDDVDAMRAKTAVKRVAKWARKSPELVTAMELDDQIDGDPKLNRPTIIDLGAHANGENESAFGEPGSDEPKEPVDRSTPALDAPRESVSFEAPPEKSDVKRPSQNF